MGKKKNSKSFGVIFWIAIVLLTVIIFIVNRSNIESALEQSSLRQLIGARNATRQSSEQSKTSDAEADSGNKAAAESSDDQNTRIEQALRELERVQLGTESDGEVAVKRKGTDKTAETEEAAVSEDAEDSNSTEQPAARTAQATRYLYFIDVDETGRITPIRVARATEQSPAPMSQSIQLLINGLIAEEEAIGLLNLVPAGSQLLSAYIDSSVAYLNFNEQFRYNPLGSEGIVAQLTQIVYSVTEFPTISRVQILINGQKVDYLNSESRVYVKEPIDRNFLIVG